MAILHASTSHAYPRYPPVELAHRASNENQADMAITRCSLPTTGRIHRQMAMPQKVSKLYYDVLLKINMTILVPKKYHD
jgi:hypothetical protein